MDWGEDIKGLLLGGSSSSEGKGALARTLLTVDLQNSLGFPYFLSATLAWAAFLVVDIWGFLGGSFMQERW
jgi:hypothetical protein